MNSYLPKDEIKKPLLLEIKGNSLDDGPGIRSVVFYKGCPLSCVWCHNPESKKSGQEISFDAKTCIGCGSCRDICPQGAISDKMRGYIDREKCDLCFLCADACPSMALTRVGEHMSVDTILEAILPDKPFFDTSGGGVTLSGGEPTLYPEFTSRLLQSLKDNGIHTLMETCGYFDPEQFMTLIYPYLDMIYFDIKLIETEAHKQYCGVPNTGILKNFQRLVEAAKRDEKHLLPRTPLVPGITDTETNIQGIAEFINAQGIDKAALLEYNPLWHEKTDKIGVPDPYKNDTTMTSFSDKAIFDRCCRIYADFGINLV